MLVTITHNAKALFAVLEFKKLKFMIPTKDEISNAARTSAQIESPTVQVLAQHYFKRGADWAISQNRNNALVSGWLEFEKHKPSSDKLILLTNGGYVEICYYENGEFKKAWAFDEDDKPVFKARVKGHPRWAELYWRYIELPTIH